MDEHLGAWVDGNRLAHSRTKRAAAQLGVDRLADEVRAAETAKATPGSIIIGHLNAKARGAKGSAQIDPIRVANFRKDRHRQQERQRQSQLYLRAAASHDTT